MRSPEQVKWDFVQQWLDKARKDLAAAEVLLKEEFGDYENVGFHAQQAAPFWFGTRLNFQRATTLPSSDNLSPVWTPDSVKRWRQPTR